MTSGLTAIMARHRAALQTQGLLRPAVETVLSPRTAGMRPSLTKIRASLAEQAKTQGDAVAYPLEKLFEQTLPRIQITLIDLGEEKADGILQALCTHGRDIIDQLGLAAAQPYLDKLFEMLPLAEPHIRAEASVDAILEAFQSYHTGGKTPQVIRYLGYFNADYFQKVSTDRKGNISVALTPTAGDEALPLIQGSRIHTLNASRSRITDAGLPLMLTIEGLEHLDLSHTAVTETGLFQLSGHATLKRLGLKGLTVSPAAVLALKIARRETSPEKNTP